jgi:rubrerythrin
MQIEPTELALGASLIKRFLYRLTSDDAKHLTMILEIIGETDNEDLEDIINEAIAQYTTPEQKPFVDAVIQNDKVRDLLESGKLKLLTEKFAELLQRVYG